jgi:flagellar L-ring protein precursor FlgH
MNIKWGKWILTLLFVCSLFLLPTQCEGGSIWAKRSKNSKAIYSDDKANQVGDILTIIINEDHKIDNKIKRQLERTSSRELELRGEEIKVEHILPEVMSIGINTSSSKALDGKADYKDERTIEDKITVVVEDIHPNGNLVVIGTRSRDVSDDKQIMQVSGIVRPSDISYDNTIRSDQVANFNLVFISDGVSGNYNNPGWLGKILDAIWPF